MSSGCRTFQPGCRGQTCPQRVPVQFVEETTVVDLPPRPPGCAAYCRMGVVDYDWDLEGDDIVEGFAFVDVVDYLLGQSC
jgi:hypothetical protein